MSPRVTFCVLNLRMGGQVSNLNSLAGPLLEAGIPSRFALPPGVPSSSKADLDAFGRKPLPSRLLGLWRMLRSLPKGEEDVLHLVLPTPAFAPVCWFIPTPTRRIILHSEGVPTSFDREHLALFREDPLFLLPRLILNHRALVKLMRRIPVTQLVAPRFFADWLRSAGFRRVADIPNIAGFQPEDSGELSGDVRDFLAGGGPTLAYIGHAHPVKGIHDLISAFPAALAKRPDLRLVLALSGDGDASKVCHSLESLPEQSRRAILLTGLVPVARLMRAIDLLLLPYRSLTSTTLYPSLLLEAEAAGCPVAISDLPEFAGLFHAKPPYLWTFPPGDTLALAAIMAEVQAKPAGPGSPSLTTLPSPADRMGALIQLYRQVLESAPAGRP